ncbi:MAG: hypothetical protein Q8R76_06850 [Candidatus Omnitrophota bacterium]|nr:hypothetical protein [Candidatus Omnitrophota bacterium]
MIQTKTMALNSESQKFIERVAGDYRFTYQESRQLEIAARDMEMWQEGSLEVLWLRIEAEAPLRLKGPQRKKHLLKKLRESLRSRQVKPTDYSGEPLPQPNRNSLKVTVKTSDKKIFGDCPVASPKTVCCNLRTIDAVENCAFGCSYCTVQTFYGDEAAFDDSLGEKLKGIELEPERFYHFGTGQSSDSLVWGNRNGILDALCNFARKNPNILLEFKTKSDNVAYFMEHELPRNIVCSWSLNAEEVIINEEHFTAGLERRIAAARKVADRGIRVAFHFHPMVYHQGWDKAYPELARRVQEQFRPEEVLFISYGSVTFIKPVVQAIRKRGEKTKILQMEMVPDPHGKLTYPDPVKFEMFRTMHKAFAPWHDGVFFYLCMERAEIWDGVFGWHYKTNEIFETEFGKSVMKKLGVKHGDSRAKQRGLSIDGN